MRTPFVLGSIVVGICLLTATHVKAAAPDLRASVGVKIRFDDNVFQYSDANLGRYDRTLAKFATIESTDDIIVTPSLDVRAVWKGRYSTRVFAGVDLNRYTNNTARSSETYTVGLAQNLSKADTLTLRYRFVPTHFGWRLADPPNQTVTYSDADLSTSSWRLSLDHDFTRDLSGEVFGSRDFRNYDAPFNHRDLTATEVGISGTMRWRPVVSVQARLAREIGDAEGSGDATINSDTSYKQWTFGIEPTFSPTPDLDLGLRYRYEQRDYTSALAADADHFERRDRSNAVGLDGALTVAKKVRLRAAYDHIKRSVTTVAPAANLDFGNYTEQRVTAGIDYRF